MRSEDAPRRGSRVRVASLLTPPLLAAALFVAWGQPWVEITLSDGVSILVSGDRAAAVLPAIAIAWLALTAALAIAAPRVRPALGVVLALLGAVSIAVSFRAVADPVIAAASGVTALTGVDGESSIRALIDDVQLTAWPLLAVIVGILATAVGLLIALTGRDPTTR
jgi:hypothetical protein